MGRNALLLRILSVTVGALALFLLWTLPAWPDLGHPDRNVLRVFTANLMTGNDQGTEATKVICAGRPHVIVLQEWTGKNADLDLLRRKGYKVIIDHPERGTHGICVLTRGFQDPVTAKVIASPVNGPCKIPIGTVRLQYKKNFYTIIGLHAPPPIEACKNTTEPTIRAVAKWIANGRLTKDIGAGRAGDLVIVAGDLNVFPFNGALETLQSTGLKDAFERTNWRYGPTYSPTQYLPAAIRIDYILSSLQPVDAKTIHLPGSDHRGVVADLKLDTPVKQQRPRRWQR